MHNAQASGRVACSITGLKFVALFDLRFCAGGMASIDTAGIDLPAGAVPHLDLPLSGSLALHRHEAETAYP